MVSKNSLISAAKDIGTYLMIAFGVYFIAIIIWVIIGFLDEIVIPAMGLNASGTAVTAIGVLFTAMGTAITAIVGLVTLVTGLMSLNIVLQVFGIELKFKFGSKV